MRPHACEAGNGDDLGSDNGSDASGDEVGAEEMRRAHEFAQQTFQHSVDASTFAGDVAARAEQHAADDATLNDYPAELQQEALLSLSLGVDSGQLAGVARGSHSSLGHRVGSGADMNCGTVRS
eukprot:5236166-Alexandrium_andersonii.AAC.1